MKTIAIAASIAIITTGGVAGIIVGDAGADIARHYSGARPMKASLAVANTTAETSRITQAPVNTSTHVMRRPAQVFAIPDAMPLASAPVELRLSHETAPTPRAQGSHTVAVPEQIATTQAWPEQSPPPHARVYPEQPVTHAPAPAAAHQSPVQQIMRAPLTPVPQQAVHLPPPPASAPQRAVTRSAPVRTAVRTPPPVAHTAPAASTAVAPAPRGRDRRQARRPAAPTVHLEPLPTTPAATSAPASPPPQGATSQTPAVAPPPSMEGAPIEATHHTTMSAPDSASSSAPASAPAPAPPAAEQPSAILANP